MSYRPIRNHGEEEIYQKQSARFKIPSRGIANSALAVLGGLEDGILLSRGELLGALLQRMDKGRHGFGLEVVGVADLVQVLGELLRELLEVEG